MFFEFFDQSQLKRTIAFNEWKLFKVNGQCPTFQILFVSRFFHSCQSCVQQIQLVFAATVFAIELSKNYRFKDDVNSTNAPMRELQYRRWCVRRERV